MREIWNAIFYLVKTGCQWRMLPSNFAPWKLVYYYYLKWCSLNEFDLLLNNLREKVRVKMGQKAECSLSIMDSQSVRWGNNRSLNGIDGNKKIKGVKRHVVVDNNGFLLAVMITIACVHDCKAAYLLARYLDKKDEILRIIFKNEFLQDDEVIKIILNNKEVVSKIVNSVSSKNSEKSQYFKDKVSSLLHSKYRINSDFIKFTGNIGISLPPVKKSTDNS